MNIDNMTRDQLKEFYEAEIRKTETLLKEGESKTKCRSKIATLRDIELFMCGEKDYIKDGIRYFCDITGQKFICLVPMGSNHLKIARLINTLSRNLKQQLNDEVLIGLANGGDEPDIIIYENGRVAEFGDDCDSFKILSPPDSNTDIEEFFYYEGVEDISDIDHEHVNDLIKSIGKEGCAIPIRENLIDLISDPRLTVYAAKFVSDKFWYLKYEEYQSKVTLENEEILEGVHTIKVTCSKINYPTIYRDMYPLEYLNFNRPTSIIPGARYSGIEPTPPNLNILECPEYPTTYNEKEREEILNRIRAVDAIIEERAKHIYNLPDLV